MCYSIKCELISDDTVRVKKYSVGLQQASLKPVANELTMWKDTKHSQKTLVFCGVTIACCLEKGLKLILIFLLITTFC